MKYLFLFASLFSLSSFIPNEENGIPSVSVKSLDGKSVNTSDIANDKKPIILCIWEMSCAPCIHEFDEISKKYENWQKEILQKLEKRPSSKKHQITSISIANQLYLQTQKSNTA